MTDGFTLLDLDAIDRALTAIVTEYEQSSPVVSRWADDLYRTVHGDDERRTGAQVTLDELMTAQILYKDGQWANAHVAQNCVYKLFERLGRDTTGMADF